MCPLRIILLYPPVRIFLYLIQAAVNLLPEGNGVKLIQYRLVEALANAVGLRRPGLCFRVVDILDGQVELILVGLPVAAVFGAPVRQDTQQPDVVFVMPGDHAVIKEIGRYQAFLQS